MEEENEWLRRQGWHIKPKALLSILNHPSEDDLSSSSSRATQPHARDDIIARLLDSDLKDVGSPSLPGASSLQRLSRLQGPLVLQVVSLRNISQSSSKSLLRSMNEQHGRLLRLGLTDGCAVISAIEYHPMPAFSLDLAPGTKVKLENTVSLQSGLLLGDAHSFTILGGVVSGLYESWSMERKYSGLTRMTGTKSAQEEGVSGPPPFHGLRVQRAGKFDLDRKPSLPQKSHQQGEHSEDLARSLQEKEVMIPSAVRERCRKGLGHQSITGMSNSIVPESLSLSRTVTSGASSSHQAESKTDLQHTDVPLGKSKDLDVRKDAIKAVLALGVEAVPLQNQAAAQKLLDRRTDFHSRKERGRVRGGRGRGRRAERQEEVTLTLDEWEAKRGVSNLSVNQMANEATTCDDEAFAQKLHYQLNVESRGHTTTGEVCGEAEQIRLSMFTFSDDKDVNDDGGRGQHGRRGRGRGRGRRRG